MPGKTEFIAEPGKPTIVIERLFDAPRELIFDAVTKPEHLAHWWGPRTLTLTVCEIDLRPGGAYRFVQRAPDGREFPFRGVFREILAPERIVQTQRYDVEPWSTQEEIVTMTLEEHGTQTKLRILEQFPSVEARDAKLKFGAKEGGVESLDRLGERLVVIAAPQEIVGSRVFDAPRELVWKTWTEPERIARWWGPKGFTNTMHEMDLRPGGAWKFIMHGPDGTNYANHSVFVEIVKPERIVFDHIAPDFRMTATFEEEGARTRVTMRMHFETAKFRDEIAKRVGAVEGLSQNLEKLGDYLGTLR